MAATQDHRNHARYVPLFHFVLGSLLLANLIHVSIDLRHPGQDTVFAFLRGLALVLMYWYVRAFPVGVQDRVIRLEMRLRVQQLAPELAPRFDELAMGQVVALRFAGDDELPGLMREVLEGRVVKPADIKRRIRHWRPDHARV